MRKGSIGIRLVLGAVLVVVLFGGWYFLLRDAGPKALEPPSINELPDRVSRNVSVSGVGEDGSVVSILVDGKSAGTAQVYVGGTWRTQIYVGVEGIHIITAEQRLGSYVSRVSEGVDTWVDITPPNAVLRVQELPPARMNKREIVFTGTSAPNAIILVNAEPLGNVDSAGNFSLTVPLDELENILVFTLSDDVGNVTEVVGEFRTLVDSTPPRIRTQYCSDDAPEDLGESEEYVCLRTGSWTPVGISARIPVSGSVVGRIESLTLNGEALASQNGSVYQEIVLPLLKDVNTYPIVAVDEYGNESTSNLVLDISD